MKTRNGFTVVELLWVITIITLLALFCMPYAPKGRKMRAAELERVMRNHLPLTNKLTPHSAQ